MYSYEERMKAVELYIKYDLSAAITVRKLGYPDRKMLVRWYKEYKETGKLHERYDKNSVYTLYQMNTAVNYYLEHGRSITQTIRAVGFPTRETLSGWIDELAPGKRKVHIKRSSMLQFSQEQKKDAVIELCAREESAAAVADKLGTSRCNLYSWKKDLLGQENAKTMKKSKQSLLPDDRDELSAEVESLNKEIYRKQMELDILNKAAEIIKKDQGIDQKNLKNKEKAFLIDALRTKYPLNDLLRMTGISKSSYFYQKEAQKHDKYASLRIVMKAIFVENHSCYGYRRVHLGIKSKGKMVSEKVVRRIMKEEQLVVPCKKKRKYSSYKGEISPAVKNVIARDFHAASPNTKWLTDLTEFNIPAGKIYLSPIIDCFDGMAVSWTIGTSPNAELVNTMLDDAISNLTDGEHPIVHSDRGCHVRQEVA